MKTMKTYMAMVGVALMAAACATEESNEMLTANRPIRFSATTTDVVTRSDLQSQQLEGYTKPLWLVPVVTTTPETATRGTQLGSTSTLESFGVSAYLHPTDASITGVKPKYFYNMQATPVPNDPDGNYAFSQDYYWPASTEALTFYAYAPYGSTNAVISDSSVAGPQTINFTVASNVTQQIDLMTAIAFKQTPSTTTTPSVNLSFKHELTGVRFVIGDQFLAGWIKSITLTNVYGKGRLTIGSTSSWTLDNDDKTDFSVSYNTDRQVAGTLNEAVTTASETFLMIPQTLGGEGQTVEIVYQDAAHNDYTVKAPLTGTWQAGQTVTYAISSTDLTTLRIGTLDFPTVSGLSKTAWENKDSVGLYVVGSNGTTLIHRNIKCTYDGTKWNIAHPAAAPIYDLPGQTYFFYYPYSATSSGQPIGYPEAASSADESADDFFANVVDQHPIAIDQSAYGDFINSDLCIAKATHAAAASTISATLARKVGLAVITLGSAQANKTRVFTNNDEGTVTETAQVTASSTFSGNIPYNNSTAYCAFVKANTATSFSSATFSTSNKDAWEASLVFNVAAGASQSKTAYSDRRNWDYVNAVWNYSYTTNNYYTWTPASQGTYSYTMECWGAQGGNYNSTYQGGKGAYTKGSIVINPSDVSNLYVYCGQHPSNASLVAGWNGGGAGRAYGASAGAKETGYAGGGATDIRLTNGDWNNFASLKSRIMVAAAGGGTGFWFEMPNRADASGKSGAGGALEGLDGHDGADYGDAYSATGGTQIDGGNCNNNFENITGSTTTTVQASGINKGGFGYGGSHTSQTGTGDCGGCGGGSGYYGGGASNRSHGGSGGGSSFISGHTGCKAITEGSTADAITHTDSPNHYSELVFTSTEMVAGNATQTQPDGSNTTGHSGNGYCRITLTRW